MVKALAGVLISFDELEALFTDQRVPGRQAFMSCFIFWKRVNSNIHHVLSILTQMRKSSV